MYVYRYFQVVYELPATSQWIFEVHWCPRNPAIISTASFDGHISMYSLLGGGGRGGAEATKEQQVCSVQCVVYMFIVKLYYTHAHAVCTNLMILWCAL